MPGSARTAGRLCLAVTLLFAAGCEPARSPDAVANRENAAEHVQEGEVPAAADPAWEAFVDRYLEDYFAAHPGFAVTQGRHEYDGLLQDWSPAGLAAESERLRQARDEALSFTGEQLGESGRFQREYLLWTIDEALFWIDKAEWPFVNPAFYFEGMSDSLDPGPYVTLDYAPPGQRMESYIRYAENVVRAAGQIRSNLRMPMSRTRLQYGIDSFGGLADYYAGDVPPVFAEVPDQALQERFAAANAAAVEAMRGLADWLQSNLDTANGGYALGADRFREMVYDTERVDIPLEELEAMARADLKRNQLALGEACAEFAPGESIRSCFARMAKRKPAGGEIESARAQVEETRVFLVEKDLVSIPGREEALVALAPPYARSDFAYISIPGPYEAGQPSVYYIAPPNPAWSDDVQQAYIPGESDLLFTSVHEVWPGHFLNFVHAKRSDWVFGRVFISYAFSEGWAHYTEEMMLDAGLRDASAETRIGYLSNALLRNVRFLSAIGLHTQGMTVEESERMFIEEAYQSEGTARQQAARGTWDPAYLNYTLGKLMIRDLRDEWTEQRDGRESWKDFHDTFLSYGGPPIPLVRAQMMKSTPEGRE